MVQLVFVNSSSFVSSGTGMPHQFFCSEIKEMAEPHIISPLNLLALEFILLNFSCFFVNLFPYYSHGLSSAFIRHLFTGIPYMFHIYSIYNPYMFHIYIDMEHIRIT